MLTGFVAGVAATVLVCLWLIPSLQSVVPEEVQVFTAVSGMNEVLLVSDSGETYFVTMQNDSVLAAKGVEATSEMLSYKHVQPEEAIQWMVLTTPRGKDYHITLSDGTQVWMNADSKLAFPEVFTGDKRMVKLWGEAYFDVAKDAAHPFEVQNEWFVTSVLGTEFNVRAYAKEEASVVLVSGKVILQDARNESDVRELLPGQKAQWAEQGGFSVENVDVYAYSQWKEGYFYFDNVTLEEILHELGRWYNVDIVVENPKQAEAHLHYVADRHRNLDEALQTLNALKVVKAVREENKVIVKEYPHSVLE